MTFEKQVHIHGSISVGWILMSRFNGSMYEWECIYNLGDTLLKCPPVGILPIYYCPSNIWKWLFPQHSTTQDFYKLLKFYSYLKGETLYLNML